MNVEAQGVLTLRSTRNGLRSLVVGNEVKWQYGDGTLGPWGHVMFVHGYNNTHEQARLSYARFRGWLGKFKANARVLELHWPGDGIYTALGAPLYPLQINRAVKCGELLARWIEAQTIGAHFVLVGHSLGCRLVLEALKALREDDRHRIHGVCLMAAAVPVRMIEKNALGPEHAPDANWRILHSRGDNVLGAVFHAGQVFDSRFTRAVGYLGGPRKRWDEVGMVEEMYDSCNDRDLYYGHGWYWPGGRIEAPAPARTPGASPLPSLRTPRANDGRSGMAVAEMLGAVMERQLPRREQPLGRVVAPSRIFWSRAVGEP